MKKLTAGTQLALAMDSGVGGKSLVLI